MRNHLYSIDRCCGTLGFHLRSHLFDLIRLPLRSASSAGSSFISKVLPVQRRSLAARALRVRTPLRWAPSSSVRSSVLARASSPCFTGTTAVWQHSRMQPRSRTSGRECKDTRSTAERWPRFWGACRRSRVALSFDPAMTAGPDSKGLQGSYSWPGFAALLAGSGLEHSIRATNSRCARRRRLRNQRLHRKRQRCLLLQLPPKRFGRGSAPRHDGRYRLLQPDITFTATGLASPRETPQSVSVIAPAHRGSGAGVGGRDTAQRARRLVHDVRPRSASAAQCAASTSAITRPTACRRSSISISASTAPAPRSTTVSRSCAAPPARARRGRPGRDDQPRAQAC